MHSQKGNNEALPRAASLPGKQDNDSVAQLVEQMTLNHWVVGSSPTGVTYKDHQKWKIAENQTFSAIFILSESLEIGKIYKNSDLCLVPAMR